MRIVRVDAGTWSFEEENVRFFLLAGKERSLLIDSGMRTHNAGELAEEFTDLPLVLLNTHADPDHTGSNAEFGEFYMHPSEAANFYGRHRGKGRLNPVWDGDEIDLGDRLLRIIAVPGHTPGSIAVLDVNSRRLFSGDPIQDGRIFMFGEGRDMHAYICGLERLAGFAGLFDEIWPSHGSCPLAPELIPRLTEAAQAILAGEAQGVREEALGRPVTAYNMDVAVFLCDEENGPSDHMERWEKDI